VLAHLVDWIGVWQGAVYDVSEAAGCPGNCGNPNVFNFVWADSVNCARVPIAPARRPTISQ
jgi:hypothetical protein